nr:immunoglobulin heavy chain junction region [Macaca mulatta]MOY19452.1 immunoglobulin heavy chain junction region [Macaca mulatta]MOY20643.1 immunoglobulin heavy chain junction region [Macaca mulatta]
CVRDVYGSGLDYW